MLTVCCTLVCIIYIFLQKGQCLAVRWNRGGSVNNKETTYVDSVLHIGVHYIYFFTEGSVFSCELSGTGEGVSITKKPRMLTVCCTLVCII